MTQTPITDALEAATEAPNNYWPDAVFATCRKLEADLTASLAVIGEMTFAHLKLRADLAALIAALEHVSAKLRAGQPADAIAREGLAGYVNATLARLTKETE